MKRTLIAAALAAAATASFAHTDKAAASAAETLRSDCAASHAVKVAAPAAANEYTFAYHKGELRGEVTAQNKNVDCSASQYAAYLNKADPMQVMQAHPTAAGKKKAAEKATK
jgi:hypothetical protein